MNHDIETRLLSVMDLAEAALGELERVDTVKLAALGRDKDAAAIGNTRRLLDRLQLEGKGLQSQLAQVTQERDDWKQRVIAARDGRCPYHPWMFVEKEQP